MIIKLFLVSRFGLVLFGFIASLLFPKNLNGSFAQSTTSPLPHFWYSLAQWDGGNYVNIGSNFYRSLEDYVFFPLYPIFIKAFTLLFQDRILSGLLISNISFILFLVFIEKFIKQKFSKALARNTVLLYLFFPTSFYTAIIYSESLFLLFVVLFLMSLDENKYFHAALMAILSQLTRFIGAFLVVSLFLKIAKSKDNLRNLWIVPFGILGTVAYSFFQFSQEGSAFIFLNAQVSWLRFPQDPVSTVFSYFWRLATLQQMPLNDLFDLAITTVFLSILIFNIKKLSAAIWAFSILVILIPASTGTLTSMPRYALASIGTFILLAKILEEKPYLKTPIFSGFLFLQIILFALFINGYWVA